VTYHAPAEPGEYRVRVRFSGYIDAGWVLADNAMPCEAETTVTVRGAVAQTPPGTGPDAQPTPPTPPPVEDIEYIEFPPHYLVHIIETRTVGGPEAQDVWILHPEKPKEDGSLLTADGTGGWFANRTDQHQGPFTNSHQVCAALRALDLDSVLWGSGFLSCRPRRR